MKLAIPETRAQAVRASKANSLAFLETYDYESDDTDDGDEHLVRSRFAAWRVFLDDMGNVQANAKFDALQAELSTYG